MGTVVFCEKQVWDLTSSGVFAREIKGRIICRVFFSPSLLVRTEYLTQAMVMWDRIVLTCFLDSDPGFQDVLFVLCLHANQYAYTEKNCSCWPQPKLISKRHVMDLLNFSCSTSVKWQLFDLSWVWAEWNFLGNCKWCLVLCTWHFGEGGSTHFFLAETTVLMPLAVGFYFTV